MEAIRAGDRQRIDELAAAVTAGRHGWLARIFVGRFDTLYDMVVEAQDGVERMRKRLQG